MKWQSIALVGLAASIVCLSKTDRAQELRPASIDTEVATVVEGHNAFAIDLFKELGRTSGNLFCSPLSISTALAMTYAGAANQTAQEMAGVAHFPADRRLLHSVQAKLLADLDPADPDRLYELRLANRLWCQRGIEFQPAFLGTCREVYGAPLEEADFAGDLERSRLTINDWIAARTGRKIPDLLRPGDVSSGTPLVLTNAIYFRAAWSQPFAAESTTTSRFYLSPNESIDTAMMRRHGRFAYADFPDLAVVELPYRADELALVVLLPKQRDGLAALERALVPARLEEWLAALEEQELSVALPRFGLASRLDLSDVLQRMGMTTAFDARADFSGMTGSRDLWLDKIVHEARIEVDEAGTEAAAATAVVMKKGHAMFRADHPFLFLIRDLRNDSILFLGRLADPRTE